jgi:hypothetical protein
VATALAAGVACLMVAVISAISGDVPPALEATVGLALTTPACGRFGECVERRLGSKSPAPWRRMTGSTTGCDAQRADRVGLGVAHLFGGERLGEPEEQVGGIVDDHVDSALFVDDPRGRGDGRLLGKQSSSMTRGSPAAPAPASRSAVARSALRPSGARIVA